MAVKELLNQASGYGVLVGVGALFAIMVLISTRLMKKYLNENTGNTEMFTVCNRSVGVGLASSAIMSSWMWATVSIWSVQMVFSYGVAAAYHYASTSSVQVVFLMLAGIECKRKIPNAHTCLEIVNLRYGKATHILYIFLCLVNNLLSCSSMILGASGAITALTGMHIVASTMLIPFGVLCYTFSGGLKGTFITEYVHTFIALIIFAYFTTASVAHNEIGSLGNLYDLVKQWQDDNEYYIEGNYQGSLLTFKSQGAIIFGLIHSIGDFGLAVMDSAFWAKAFAAKTETMVPAYIIGSITIYACSWPLGTVMGLIGAYMSTKPSFPTYPNPMNADEIANAFLLPYTLKALLGNGACGALLLALYMAVTSTVSSQMVSVSSILSFDVYRTYINPEAQNKQMIKVTHFGVVFFGLFSAGFSVMLHYVGVSLTWMGYFYSMIICGGVIPLLLSILWSRQTTVAAFVAPIAGISTGIATWLSVAKTMYGDLSVASTGQQLPCLYGGLVTIFVPGIVTVLVSLLYKPYKFDWARLQDATLVEGEEDSSESEFEKDNLSHSDEDKEIKGVVPEYTTEIGSIESPTDREKELVKIKFWLKVARIYLVINVLVTQVLWPMPLYRNWIWSRSFFEGWAGASIGSTYLAIVLVCIYPLWDGRHALKKVACGVYRDYIKRENKQENKHLVEPVIESK
ncbi:hypothetical protein LJB42_003148 [Komagataella kurtzmanii]|nr:hypothetical protein LJB42_003148 [Komagataella kurtzmanii]